MTALSRSFKNKSILMPIVVYVTSLPVISGVAYVVLGNNAIRDACSTGKVYRLFSGEMGREEPDPPTGA